MAKQHFQPFHLYLREDVKPSAGHKTAIGYKAMEMRVEVDEITKGLDGNYDSWNSYLHSSLQGR